MKILVSNDIPEEVRVALSQKFNAYCRPLPATYTLPNILITGVGGTEENDIDTMDIVLDARAETAAEALDTINKAIGALKYYAGEQGTAIRYVYINTLPQEAVVDPVRPDLSMCTARLRIVAHKKEIEI